MKKLFTILLTLFMLLTLVGCASDGDKEEEKKEEQQQVVVDEDKGDKEEDNTADDLTDDELEDLGNLEFGVETDGNKVIWTIEDEVDGVAVNVEFVFVFENDKIVKCTSTYHCPDEATAIEGEKEMTNDETVVVGSVVRNGKDLTCEMNEVFLADFEDIDQETLVLVLEFFAHPEMLEEMMEEE